MIEFYHIISHHITPHPLYQVLIDKLSKPLSDDLSELSKMVRMDVLESELKRRIDIILLPLLTNEIVDKLPHKVVSSKLTTSGSGSDGGDDDIRSMLRGGISPGGEYIEQAVIRSVMRVVSYSVIPVLATVLSPPHDHQYHHGDYYTLYHASYYADYYVKYYESYYNNAVDELMKKIK